jgi:hypothetical protein
VGFNGVSTWMMSPGCRSSAGQSRGSFLSPVSFWWMPMTPWQPWYPSPMEIRLGFRKTRAAWKAERPEA